MTDETTSHLVDLIQRDRRTDSTIVVCLLHQKIPGGIKSNTKLAIVKFFNFRLISILIGPQAKVGILRCIIRTGFFKQNLHKKVCIIHG